VKSFTNERNEFKLVADNLAQINSIYAKQSQEFHILDFIRNLSLSIILVIVNVIVFYKTFQGEFSFGDLILIIQLIDQARRPLFAMSFILEQVQRAESGSKEFFDVLTLESTEDYSKLEEIKLITNPEIELKDVQFKYETSDQVLDKINFRIGNNETVALVGPSGAGKSTIINLILKFYNPTDGSILLNGKDYSGLSHRFIRENISLVFQENELFSSTIRENVAYGQIATEAEVIAALQKANAWSFVQRLPNGIDSDIGERGVRLSGGQKQRIQIARAILKNAPILILDEATSSLDAKSENEVQSALENLMQDKLVLVIAHRFSTIQNASKVIVLNNKRIEDIGSPQELAKRPGIYADLLNYQIQGNKKLLEKFDIY
jgi:ATP-binding cassette subfamily B protein